MVSTSLESVAGNTASLKVEEKIVRTEPYVCDCLKCFYHWVTRDLGEGHEEPKRCANPKCRSPYWNDAPKAWLKPEFDPYSIINPNTGEPSEPAIKRCILERKRRNLPLPSSKPAHINF